MFVRAEWTRRGIGRAILLSCERAAAEAGFRTMALMATLPGVPLYRAFGFTDVEPATVTMPDGVSIDALSMTRPISPDFPVPLTRPPAARGPPANPDMRRGRTERLACASRP